MRATVDAWHGVARGPSPIHYKQPSPERTDANAAVVAAIERKGYVGLRIVD